MREFSTKCVHSGTVKDIINKGANSPIYTSTAYGYIDSEENVYPRYMNTPNAIAVGEKIASLEETENALVFSSGMAAITTTIFGLLKSGDHIIFQKGLYGGTSNLVLNELNKFGIRYSIAGGNTPESLLKEANDNTKIIYLESPSNPLLNITDIKAAAITAKSIGALTVIDNTFASPANQKPIRQGADIIIHSATKYLSGHSDICAGVVASSNEIIKKIKITANSFGGSLNAITLYLLERSIKTLDVRIQRINSNAMAIAEFLAMHPKVEKIFYPGLPEHEGYDIARKQMTGFGGMLSFVVKELGSIEFQKKLKLIKPSISLGGVESIVSSPSHTSHQHLGVEGRKKEGIPEELIRMSVGIESFQDLIVDIDDALA